MIFAGIDPGTNITGYGIIRVDGNRVSWVDSGVIKTNAHDSLSGKLEAIYDGVLGIFGTHKPDCVSVEQAFYAKNVHTTLILGHARGVILLAAQKAGAALLEFSPREIKKAVVGNGNAQKEQVEYMIKMIVQPQGKQMLPDAYDALAAALCGYYNFTTSLAVKKTSC